MTLKETEAAILVSASGGEGLPFLREITEAVNRTAAVQKVSSIFKVQGVHREPAHIHDLRSITQFESFNYCVLVEAPQGPLELLRSLKAIEARQNQQSMRRGVKLIVLFYGTMNQMTPELTIPFDKLHLRVDYLFPVAEILPEFVHPVLGSSLREMAKPFRDNSWGEFFCQGKSVLDF